MLIEHSHKPGDFDPGRCQDCDRQTDLPDHYDHVQRQEAALAQAHRWARQARQQATWALCATGIGVLVGLGALLVG